VSDIDPSKGSLNTQLANAVAAVAVANDRLAAMRDSLAAAQREETTAINKVNEAQKHFDDLVAMVKKSAPRNTDWRRPVGMPAGD
jgi:hypothetical protein